MEVQAKAKFIRISPKKVRLVAGLVRGVNASEALVRLQFANKNAALSVAKVVKSAIANAEENFKLDRNNLFVKEIKIDEGPTIKRWMPRAFGRASQIMKRTSHISVILSEKVPTAMRAKKEDKKTDDLIKVGSAGEIKKEARSDIKHNDEFEVGGKKSGQTKGFAGKVFNRKGGDK